MQPATTGKGMLFALLAFFLLVLSDATVKDLTDRYSVWQIVFLMAATSIPITALIAWYHDRAACLKLKNLRVQLARGIFVTLNALFIFRGFSLLPLADAYALAFTSPIIITILAVIFLKEKAGLVGWLAVLIGFSGVLTVAFQPLNLSGEAEATELSSAYFEGVLCVLGAATCFSSANILVRSQASKAHPISFHFYSMLFVMLPTMIFMWMLDITLPDLFDKPVLQAATMLDSGLMLAIGLISSVGAICLVTAYQYAPASMIAPFQYSQIVWGSLIGYFIFGDELSSSTLAGAGFIIASGFLILSHRVHLARKLKKQNLQKAH